MRETDQPVELARAVAADHPVAGLLARYRSVRQASESLTRSLTPEDMAAQSMPDASPTKWHLAHTTWFFETFVLTPRLLGYKAFDVRFGYLFNSYYEAVGPRQPRPARGMLTRPSLADILAYRAYVDAAMIRLLAAEVDPALCDLIVLGLAHEEQHQELILMDILHLFAQSPLSPAFVPPRAPDPGAKAPPISYVGFQGGLVQIGYGGKAFAFDNEAPRHSVWLEPYRISDRLVTNSDWLAFMDDGGYRRAEFWLADGWALAQAENWQAPIYWRAVEGGWYAVGLHGLRTLDPVAPVSHVSYYEADAYAAWAGVRLPTEAEWEHAVASTVSDREPTLAGHYDARAATPGPGLRQISGELWQWTRSAYLPYPGFRTAPGAVGEYNGKFMSGQFVLRGGACVTPEGHARSSYRNFFYPGQRWMFSGVRLALDGVAERTEVSDLARDVLAGLSKSQKSIPPKHFYDAAGSDLFEMITELAEYYPTRTEIALLRQSAPDIVGHIPAGAALVEFGSGASIKTRILLEAASQIAVYAPIDISETALAGAASSLRADYPDLVVAPLRDDFTNALALPPACAGRPVVGFFPGSTIGNFSSEEALTFLEGARRLLGEGASFIVGIDLIKDEPTLLAAYDDAQGVTAAFNKNLLSRANRELNADFDLNAFAHQAIWNEAKYRIEMHLMSLKDQVVTVSGERFAFKAGETLHTENSHKFTVARLADLANRSGWTLEREWVSSHPAFAIVLLRA